MLSKLIELCDITVSRLVLAWCSSITDAGLSHLTKLDELRSIDLHHCTHITDAGLEKVGALSQVYKCGLRSLSLKSQPPCSIYEHEHE